MSNKEKFNELLDCIGFLLFIAFVLLIAVYYPVGVNHVK